MYQENEDDWKILKEYKQKKRNELAEERERAKKVGNRATRAKPRVEGELQALEQSYEGTTSVRKKTQIGWNIKDKKRELEAVEHDIKKAEELQLKYTKDIEKLNVQIEEIDKKIKEIRRKNQEQQSAESCQQKKEPVQKCPKKCRISDIKIGCDHGKHLEVPPYEKEMPAFHVISASSGEKRDVIEVAFSGSCDHGKSQSASDSEKYKERSRSSGADQYCPRIVINNATDGTDIQRPSKTKFLTSTEEFQTNSTPLGFLFNYLIFKKDRQSSGSSYDAVEYDMHFTSCQGDLPYKALVVAYPQCSWGVEFSFGYTAEYEKHETSRKFAQGKVKDFDALKAKGTWGSAIKATYTYDLYTNEIEQELNFKALLEELKGSWSVLQKLEEFFSPINGFVESAVGYSEGDEKKYDNKLNKAKNKDKLLSERKLAKIKVEWPNIKIAGKYQRVEVAGGIGIGGQGSLKLEFSPLFGMTGTVDIVQVILSYLSGGFATFLDKVVNMSVGYTNEKGEIDKTRSYVESNIELLFGATTNVSGSVGFESDPEKGWHAAAGATGVSGFIGLVLEGKAKIEGKVWVVKIGAGAEFKMTDESGEKQPGIEIDYKPTVINEEFSWAGKMEFNGLSVTWALYQNIGAEGAVEDGNDEKRKAKKKFGAAKVKADREVKSKGKHNLFKKRLLFGESDVNKIGT